MKNKIKTSLLVLALTMMLGLGACNISKNSKDSSSQGSSNNSSHIDSSDVSSSDSTGPSSESSDSSESSESSESSQPLQTFTVRFLVDGLVVQTSEVTEGDYAEYLGATPTKMADADAIRYRFKGWDKSLEQPIVANTDFNAQFSGYKSEILIDDFEDIEDSPSIKDDGWVALTYSSSGWTTETKAAVSLGTKSVEGEKALRFDAWENATDYKFAKIFDKTIPYAANALKFRLMIPSINTVKVLIHCAVNIGGTVQAPYFSYNLHPDTSEYVEYVIPLDDPNWAMWGEAGKSIASVADWTGIHQDDILNYLTRIEFYSNGDDKIQGQPYIAFLDSIRFVTLDNPSVSRIETMGSYNRYSGTLNDGHIVSIEFDNENNATAKVVDLEVPQTVNGKVALDKDNKTFSFVSNDNGQTLTYNGRLVNGSQQIAYVSATGAFKDNVENMDLNSIQIVDNYEQYTEDGQAYYQSNPYKNNRSGARGAYYGEYYADSGSTEWGGNGWSLLGGNGDQLKLKQGASGAHSGNNYICMKNSRYNAIRYMQWGLFDGSSEVNAYRGSKLSFWAKTQGVVPAFKVVMYSQTHPVNATKDNSRKEIIINPEGVLDEWTHYELELNPKLTYYGFLVFMEKNNTADSYLYIDDVEVYSANPYATYVVPEPDKVLTAGLSFTSKINGLIKAELQVNSGTEVTISVPGLNTSVSGTYVIEDDELTMTFGETVYVGTLNEASDKITFKSITGSDLVATALNGLSFDMINYADNAESYKSDGTMYYQGAPASSRSGARGAYYCEYAYSDGNSPLGGAGWILMGGSGDQLQLDKANHYEGNKSLKMKQSTAGTMRYFQWGLFDGSAEGHTGFNKFVIYLKNTNGFASTSIKIMVFKVQHLTGETLGEENRVTKEVTLAANADWTEYTLDLDPTETYYGYAIEFAKASNTGFINVDYAHYSSEDTNPNLNFYAKKDLVLNGTIVPGAASLKFDEGGKAYFTCENASMNNVEVTYSMAMNGDVQEMTVVINDSTIRGSYSVDMTGNVTFIVIEASGSLASNVPADTTFTNN